MKILEDCVTQVVGSEVCMRDPRIIVQKLGSEVCAAKSLDGPNPYFAHNIFVKYNVFNCVCAIIVDYLCRQKA